MGKQGPPLANAILTFQTEAQTGFADIDMLLKIFLQLILLIHLMATMKVLRYYREMSENDLATILSGDACPQDYRTLKIIGVASVLGIPQDNLFYKGIWKNIQIYIPRIIVQSI